MCFIFDQATMAQEQKSEVPGKCVFVPLFRFIFIYVIKENEAIQFTEGHRGRQNVFRWPKNLFLIAIDCHRLSSIPIFFWEVKKK